jgi:hypothetical protein
MEMRSRDAFFAPELCHSTAKTFFARPSSARDLRQSEPAVAPAFVQITLNEP